MSLVALPLPAPSEYEPILRALSDEELHGIIEALSDVERRTDENDRLRSAIVRELSTREAYMRTSHRNHPTNRSRP